MWHRFGYLSYWLWFFIKENERKDWCTDGPHCGCDQHSGGYED